MTSIVAREDRVMAEASAWLARLQRDEVSDADGLEFAAWLEASPSHEAAYRRALAVWHEFEAGADAVIANLEADARRASVRRIPTRRWMVGAGGFAIAATLALAVLPPLLEQPTIQTYATGKGQHQRITLADGSIVDLNAETSLKVRFARSAREVTMGDGEAIFDVAHDQRRPFTVAASNHVVRVVGTQFDVRNRQGDLTVTVARGKVQVRPVDASTGRSFVLTPGQRLEIGRGGVEKLQIVDAQEAFGWRVGRLVYRGEPLGEVVADLNRQFVEQIEIGDPELANIPITGVIVLDDPTAVLSRLTLMLPIRSVPSDRGLLLLRK